MKTIRARNPNDLNMLVAIHVMGEDLTPKRDDILLRIGQNAVACTGEVFELRNGERLPMPHWKELRVPETSDPDANANTNTRYMIYVGEHLEDRHFAEYADYIIRPNPYAHMLSYAQEVLAAMAARGYGFSITNRDKRVVCVTFAPMDGPHVDFITERPGKGFCRGTISSIADTICRAAVEAVAGIRIGS